MIMHGRTYTRTDSLKTECLRQLIAKEGIKTFIESAESI